MFGGQIFLFIFGGRISFANFDFKIVLEENIILEKYLEDESFFSDFFDCKIFFWQTFGGQ